jgi:hypothetical protein
MKRILCLTMFIIIVCTISMAQTVVTVPGDFSSIEDAITANTSTGIHSAEKVSYTINVDPTNTYTEQLCLNDGEVGAGDIQANTFTIQSATPGTYAWVYLQLHPTADNDAIELYTTATLTIKDIAFCPSQTAPVFTDEFIKIDKNSPSAASPYVFDHCLFTEIKADGSPMITSRSEAFTAPPAVGSTRSGFCYIMQMWGEPGEAFDITLNDCVLYGNTQQTAFRIAPETDGDVVTIHNTVIAYAGSYLIRCGSGGGSCALTISGTDVGAGTDSCSVLYHPNGDDHCVYDAADCRSININNTILADEAGGITRGISANSTADLTLADVIIDVPGPAIVDGPTNDSTWDRVTINTPSNALFAVAGTGSITATDCIFTGSGSKLAGTQPDGGIICNNCAFPTDGPDAVTSNDDGVLTVTYNDTVVADPIYLSKDVTSDSFFDVDNPVYAGVASGAGDLSGGADFIGGWVPPLAANNSWNLYE